MYDFIFLSEKIRKRLNNGVWKQNNVATNSISYKLWEDNIENKVNTYGQRGNARKLKSQIHETKWQKTKNSYSVECKYDLI